MDQNSGDLKTKTSIYRKVRPFFRIMAPFKLFRMGQGSTSRSTSQENEPDQPANLVITTTSLNKLTSIMTSPSAHYINIDECDQASENSSLMSLNNDQRVLLSSGSTSDQIGNLFFLLTLYSRENFWQVAFFDVRPKKNSFVLQGFLNSFSKFFSFFSKFSLHPL